MPKTLTIHLLLACFAFASCSEHTGTVLQQSSGPEAPINEPDTNVFEPIAGGGGNGGGDTSEPTGNGAGSGSSADPGDPTSEPGTGGGGEGGGGQGGNGQGGNGQGGSTGSTGEPGGGNPGEEPTEGGNGGQPVPEPGTLLLVGSGLAGVGASLLRRRRRRDGKPA